MKHDYSKIILNTEQLKRITIRRDRLSTTQGFATVLVDGKPVMDYYEGRIFSFGDTITLHEDGKYYSDKKDIDFIKAALHHKLNYIYHYREMIIAALMA